MFVEKLITDNLDIWASAIKTKSASGRGSSKKLELYGIKKLRELILELAVRGKLVPQDTNDEPADKLLERIAIEKEQLIKDKKIRKQKPLPPVEDNECVYEIPNTWVWTRLGDVTNYGMALKAEPKDVDEFTWVLELEDVEKVTSKLLKKVRYKDRPFKSSKNIFYEGDVIYGKLRPYLDKVLVAGENGVCTTEMIPLRGYKHIEPTFLRLLLKSPKFIEYANASTHGMNLPRMGTDKARLAALPLAPENEQKRIVAKVDELMALCDQLESQTEASIEAHQTLVKTLLETLTNAKDADELNESWQCISEHFDELFTTEDSIDQLKQAILQLAVMGKLVKQDPNDEPASKLLERIAKEKAQLIKDKKFQKTSKLKPKVESILYPNNWVEVQIGEVCPSIVPNRDKPKSFTGNIPWVTLPAFPKNSWYLRKDDVEFGMSEKEVQEYSARIIPTNSVLMSCVGRFGLTAINREPVSSNQQVHGFVVLEGLLPEYLSIAIRVAGEKLYSVATSTTIAYLNKTNCESIQFGLPPFPEQQRVVSKVNELMGICDTLKSLLKDEQTTQLQLSDAIVEQAS